MSSGPPTSPASGLSAGLESPSGAALDLPTGERAHPDPCTPGPSPAASVQRCLNCDAELTGRYCAQCGQDAHRRVLSLRDTLADLIEDLSQADARVWRTLRLLALRPGELTCEYLRGRRASFTPPLRLYVALSLLLFLVTLLPGAGPSVKSTVTSTSTEPVTLAPEALAALDAKLEKVDEGYRDAIRQLVIVAAAEVPAEQQVRVATDLAKACGESPLGVAALSSGIGRELPHAEMLANCEKVAGSAQKLISEGTEYAPKMMVFFLPLIALFGQLLYLGSRRHYIGHLVFFVHFHAFVFLVMATGNLASSLAGLGGIKWLESGADLIVLGLILWVPIYLYKALRRVYAQGRWVTRIKFMLLGLGYLINFLISTVLLAVFVALQSDVDWRGALDAIVTAQADLS